MPDVRRPSRFAFTALGSSRAEGGKTPWNSWFHVQVQTAVDDWQGELSFAGIDASRRKPLTNFNRALNGVVSILSTGSSAVLFPGELDDPSTGKRCIERSRRAVERLWERSPNALRLATALYIERRQLDEARRLGVVVVDGEIRAERRLDLLPY